MSSKDNKLGSETRMDSEKCKVLLTVINEGSLSKAADVLGYTVSGVSRSLTALEDECGFQLLFRDRHGVKLTTECKELLPVFWEYSKVTEKLQDTIGTIKGFHLGKVSVGVVYVNHFRWISKLIKMFQMDYPEIEISIVQGNSTELIAALLEHKLDFVIASKRNGEFNLIHLQQVQMCACVAASHPLAKSKVYPLKQFEADKMIAPYSDSETDYAIALKENMINPNIVHVTSDVYSAYSMVEAGLGVAFFNKLEPECWDGNVVLLPTDPIVKVDIEIMYLGNEIGPSARKFLDMVCNNIDCSMFE